MTPIDFGRKFRYCVNLSSINGDIYAAALISNHCWLIDWPERSEDCLNSYRCKCKYCSSHRQFTKYIGGGIVDIRKKTLRNLFPDEQYPSESLLYPYISFNRVTHRLVIPPWLEKI